MGDSREDHCWGDEGCNQAVRTKAMMMMMMMMMMIMMMLYDDNDNSSNNNNNNNDKNTKTVEHIISVCPILAKDQYIRGRET